MSNPVHDLSLRVAAVTLALATFLGCAGRTASVDRAPPQVGSVHDGFGDDVDRQRATDAIHANWRDFADAEGPIAGYEWAIGTTPGGQDVQPWTDVGPEARANAGGLSLRAGERYFVSVRARDLAGNHSAVATSDGVVIDAAPSSDPVRAAGPAAGGAAVVAGPATPATELEQWGITWRFAAPAPAGRFANGDWWVVGPVTVTAITPPTGTVDGRVINGSMINPDATGRQGYDSTLYHTYQNGDLVYDAGRNVALSLPRVVPPGSSLISTVSNLDSASGNVSQLQKAAVLTVLGAAPPAGSFRPPYAGTDKTVRHHEDQLDLDALARLQPEPGAPAFAALEAAFEKVWLDHAASWLSAYLHPVENMPFYYREFTALTGSAALLLHCDFPPQQKRTLLIRLVQVGIDNFGVMQAGGRWYTNGHCNGRKFPILFAGRMLGDAAMLAAGVTWATVFRGPGHPDNTPVGFSEDGQVFYVEQTAPGVYNWGHGGYGAAHVGLPEWGQAHVGNLAGDNADWMGDPYRRCCSANGWTGITLAMRVMGLQAAWNNQAFFDYMDRYTQIETPGTATHSWDPWQGRMWQALRRRY